MSWEFLFYNDVIYSNNRTLGISRIYISNLYNWKKHINFLNDWYNTMKVYTFPMTKLPTWGITTTLSFMVLTEITGREWWWEVAFEFDSEPPEGLRTSWSIRARPISEALMNPSLEYVPWPERAWFERHILSPEWKNRSISFVIQLLDQLNTDLVDKHLRRKSIPFFSI